MLHKWLPTDGSGLIRHFRRTLEAVRWRSIRRSLADGVAVPVAAAGGDAVAVAGGDCGHAGVAVRSAARCEAVPAET